MRPVTPIFAALTIFSFIGGGFAPGPGSGGSGTPGGNANELQYNNSNAFGGIANVESDGTRLSFVGETSHPAAPASNSLQYDLLPLSDGPTMPLRRDSFMGLPIPIGMTNEFRSFGSVANWRLSGSRACNNQSSTFCSVGQYAQTISTPTVIGSQSAIAWDAGSWEGRQAWNNATNNSVNASAEIRENQEQCSRLGGFIFFTRVRYHIGNGVMKTLIGLTDAPGALTAGLEPSQAVNTIYIGCDSTDDTLRACSNNLTTGTSCSAGFGANFPCKGVGIASGAGQIYDIWLAQAPNAGTVYYYVERMPSAGHAGGEVASGSLTNNLPDNNVQLSWRAMFGSADGGIAGAVIHLHWSEAIIACGK